MAAEHDFSGVWRSAYRYTSKTRGPGEYESEHYVTIERKGNRLAVKSLPNTDDSQLLLHLTLEDRIATGSWHEKTSERGHFLGLTYSGTIQLVVSEDGQRMEGRWLGVSRHMEVKDGTWEVVHIGQKVPQGVSTHKDEKKGS